MFYYVPLFVVYELYVILSFFNSLFVCNFNCFFSVTEKVINLLDNILNEDIEELEKEIRFKYRNQIMMTVYLLCQFTHAFEDEILKKTANQAATKVKYFLIVYVSLFELL